MLVTGYDLDARAWIELGDNEPPAAAADRRTVDLRTCSSRRSTTASSTRLLADARTAVGLRDDNGAVTGRVADGPAAPGDAGGRRPAVRRRSELGGRGDRRRARRPVGRPASRSTSRSSETRRDERAANSALDAPQTLGPEFAIPPLGALPRPLRTIGAAQLATAEHMFTGQQASVVGTASYTGRALVVDDPPWP
jgi:hypothetical protein